MSRDVGRVGKPTGLSQAEPQEGLGPPGFDPSRFGGPYAIPWPPSGCRLSLTIIPRQRSFGLWWSLLDQCGAWFDGGHISTHRTRFNAQVKARLVGKYLASRDSDGSPEGRDATRLGAEHDSAGPKDIARTASEPNS